ncbi:hypothetical protein M8994_17370 [Brucella sp. 21LCYQ03]|nr:hypothetical protein [Brucella sp. 21LCYQ03]
MNKPQSTDSFFTTINEFDPQVKNFRAEPSEELIEAATRRLAALKGPMYAAVRMQRIADICAGVHVMPIEHWNRKPEPAGQPVPPKPKSWKDVIVGALKKPTMNYPFLMGWLFCLLFMCALDLLRLAL